LRLSFPSEGERHDGLRLGKAVRMLQVLPATGNLACWWMSVRLTLGVSNPPYAATRSPLNRSRLRSVSAAAVVRGCEPSSVAACAGPGCDESTAGAAGEFANPRRTWNIASNTALKRTHNGRPQHCALSSPSAVAVRLARTPRRCMSTVTALTELFTQNAFVASVLVVIVAVIGIGSLTDSLGKLQGFITKIAFEWTSRRHPTNPHAERFERLKREVMYVSIVNNLPVELHKLRTLFIEAGLITRPGFSEFYEQWLDQPFVEVGVPVLVPGFFSSERLAQLRVLNRPGFRGG
jgi:hypothetical protein